MKSTDVYITLDKPRRLYFRHQDLRDAVAASGKSIIELLNDPFFGYAHLIVAGLRFGERGITLNKASEYIDAFVDHQRQEGDQNPLNTLGLKLMDALAAAGFIKAEARPEGAEDPGAEGNAPASATGN